MQSSEVIPRGKHTCSILCSLESRREVRHHPGLIIKSSFISNDCFGPQVCSIGLISAVCAGTHLTIRSISELKNIPVEAVSLNEPWGEVGTGGGAMSSRIKS